MVGGAGLQKGGAMLLFYLQPNATNALPISPLQKVILLQTVDSTLYSRVFILH